MVLFPVSLRECVLKLVKRMNVDTNYGVAILHLFSHLKYRSPVWESAAECLLQLLERQVYSVAFFGSEFLAVVSSTSCGWV